MKRNALLKHLRLHGCVLKREGRSHSLWLNPSMVRSKPFLGTLRSRTSWRGRSAGTCRYLKSVEWCLPLSFLQSGNEPFIPTDPRYNDEMKLAACWFAVALAWRGADVSVAPRPDGPQLTARGVVRHGSAGAVGLAQLDRGRRA